MAMRSNSNITYYKYTLYIYIYTYANCKWNIRSLFFLFYIVNKGMRFWYKFNNLFLKILKIPYLNLYELPMNTLPFYLATPLANIIETKEIIKWQSLTLNKNLMFNLLTQNLFQVQSLVIYKSWHLTLIDTLHLSYHDVKLMST